MKKTGLRNINVRRTRTGRPFCEVEIMVNGERHFSTHRKLSQAVLARGEHKPLLAKRPRPGPLFASKALRTKW